MQKFSEYYYHDMQTEGLKHVVPGLLAGALMLNPLLKADNTASHSTHTTHASHTSHSLLTPLKEADNINTVAATLIGEAGGEGVNGMHAVLNVIMNRAKGDFTKAGAVCIQPKQFSMWNGKKHDDVIAHAQKHPRWKAALDLIKSAQDGSLKDITSGATFYYPPKQITPSWLPSMEQTVIIGNHAFCKPKK